MPIRLSPGDHYERIIRQEVLPVRFSIEQIVHGFLQFANRERPSALKGVSLVRIAGQAIDLSNGNRGEIRRLFEKIKPGSAFLVLGHGGSIPCGAVKAKIESMSGRLSSEPEIVRRLIENISPEIREDMDSLKASMINAIYQARKILEDTEFASHIKDRRITVVAAVCDDTIEFNVLNKNIRNEDELFEEHPKLYALRLQIVKGLRKVRKDGIDLSTHYAHAIVLYDPSRMRHILDPYDPMLDIAGISCVDTRLSPLTPDGPGYLFRTGPNAIFRVTVRHISGGKVDISYDDGGSTRYALGHVKGVNSLATAAHGNGHVLCLDDSLSLINARATKKEILEIEGVRQATLNGDTITLVGFDGQGLRIENGSLDVHADFEYRPKVKIL